MNVGQCGLFGRHLEDMEDVDDRYNTPIDISTGFAASLGMALYEQDVVMEDRVGDM